MKRIEAGQRDNRKIKGWKAKAMGLLFALLLAWQSAAGLQTADAAAAGSVSPGLVQQAIHDAAEQIRQSEALSDWGALALAEAGLDVPASYLSGVEEALKADGGAFRRITDLERTALGVKAAGGDPQHVSGYDLIGQMVSSEKMTAQGINGPAYALIVLHSGHYPLAVDALWNESRLIDRIVGQRNADGGWALIKGRDSDIDVTSMVITALAPYDGQREDVHQALHDAAVWLLGQQTDGGGFAGGTANSESTAQALIAVAAWDGSSADLSAGDAMSGLLNDLLRYRLSDGSFEHTAGDGANGMATEQALLALIAYDRYVRGEVGLFQPADSGEAQPGGAEVHVSVEGPEKAVAAGVVTATDALDALRRLSEGRFSVQLTEASFGTFVSSVEGIESGQYGGYDGWLFAVRRGGEWIFPQVSMGDFKLQKHDEVTVYYGDQTQLVQSISLEPAQPVPGEPFAVKVRQAEWDWQANEMVVTAAVGAQVTVDGVTVRTDEAGTALFEAGLAAGAYPLEVSGYADQAAPKLVRSGKTLYVYSDASEASGWAADAIQRATGYGLISGTDPAGLKFDPSAALSRAEWAALLIRLTGETPLEGEAQPYDDVSLQSWYSGAVARAKQLGLVDGAAAQFRPNQPVTRQEMAVMLARALHLPQQAADGLSGLSDLDQAYAAAIPYIAAVYQAELMLGSDGRFDPKGNVTREMAAVVVVKAYELPR